MWELQYCYRGQWENPATYTGDSASAFWHETQEGAFNHAKYLSEFDWGNYRLVEIDDEGVEIDYLADDEE